LSPKGSPGGSGSNSPHTAADKGELSQLREMYNTERKKRATLEEDLKKKSEEFEALQKSHAQELEDVKAELSAANGIVKVA